MPVLIFGSWVLNEIWIIDLSSVLVSMLMSPSKFFFSNGPHLNSGARLFALHAPLLTIVSVFDGLVYGLQFWPNFSSVL